MIDQLAETIGMNPEQLQQLLYILFTGVIGLTIRYGYVRIRDLQNDVKNAREERQIEIEKIRSDMKMKEEAQKADTKEKEALFQLFRDQTDAQNKLAETLREDNQARRTLDYETENERNNTLRDLNNTIGELKEVLEVHTARYQMLENQVQSIGSHVETSVQAIRTIVSNHIHELEDDRNAHSVSAQARHDALIHKLAELQRTANDIYGILLPPPKPPLELPQKLNKKTDENEKQEKTG